MVPFEVRSFADGPTQVSYEVWGDGPDTLVYLHGILLDAHTNHRLARDLAERGYRVVLPDLPGHGRSDKPLHATAHRIDRYATTVLGLIEALGDEPVVLGGMSLGADVSLQVAARAPERVRGLILEMPVLERAAPAAALIFTPLLLATHYAAPALRWVSSAVSRLPRHRLGPLDQVVGALLLGPDEMTAVLHGVLMGPVAPTLDERRALAMPALVIGHRADGLHPFADADRLSHQLPDARLVRAGSVVELRLHPQRLTAEIADFLDSVYDPTPDAEAAS
jgi:pimeloyl-ACP methyl ester carboxylesterase